MPATFAHIVQDGDRIAVYPAFRSIEVPPEHRLRPPVSEHRFVADVHLGRLASYLRVLGFDTVYRIEAGDAELAHIASTEARILLTRDRGLLKRAEVMYGYFVRESAPWMQLAEVVRRYDLAGKAKPFTRCLVCNALLKAVAKDAVADRLEPKRRLCFEEFRECPSCRRIYWGGSHWERMRRLVEQVVAQGRDEMNRA